MKWYEKSVAYQIFPYSFKDSDNDGVGDLRGVIEKLPYLSLLGIDLIWLTPIYKSPLIDSGYDISDHYAINEQLGNMQIFKELIAKAHEMGIKIIIDLVLNHTSDQHPWFKKALLNKDNPYHDYYYFLDPIIKDGKKYPPCNWKSFFSDSAFEYVEHLDQYYLHIFDKKMPDLNYQNPKVVEEMVAMANFYLDLGVDGFRLDAIAHLAKDLTFSNSNIDVDEYGLAYDPSKFSNREDNFDYLDKFKTSVFKKENIFTIGEVGGCAGISDAIKYADKEKGYFNMVFNFDTCWENGAYNSIDKTDNEIKTNVVNLKQLFKKWYDGCHKRCMMPIYWLNHDHPRLISQYGSIKYRKESAKALALITLFLYGTPFIYQGEELGLSNVDYNELDDFKDISAINFINNYGFNYDHDTLIRFLRRTSRISARAPMIWCNDINGGFSKAKPYIKINSQDLLFNAEDAIKDEDSIFNFYRRAISYKKEYQDIINGELHFVDIDHPNLFIFKHLLAEAELMVISNITDQEVKYCFNYDDYHILLHNYQDIDNDMIRPFECYLMLKKDSKEVN
ncbi:MAG: alpha-glucosidase [Erysipelotrichaceae bacterium]|nr:alpha-glucosidase [Erysipelotrichaceae bacterium]